MGLESLMGLGASVPGVGGAGAGGSYSAESGVKGDVNPNVVAGGAGNRGFINNVAFPGATQSNDQGINPPALAGKSGFFMYAVGAGVLLLLLLIARRKI